MAKTLEFEIKSTVVVDVDDLADELWRGVEGILQDYQGLTDSEIEAINFEAVKEAVALKWLDE